MTTTSALPPAAPRAPASAPLVAAAGLAALAVAVGVGRFAFTPILPMMQAGEGLSVRDGAWLGSANYLGYLAGSIAAVWLRAPAGAAARAGLASIAGTTLAMGWADGFAPRVALRALAGVASAWALIAVSASCLGRLAAAGRPSLGGVVFAGVGAGIAVAGGVCLVVMERGGGADEAWVALGVLSLVATAWIWPMFGATGGARPGPPPPAPPRWTRTEARLVACYGAWGFGYIVPATFLPAMARQLAGDPALFGWAWPVFGIASVAATLAAGACAWRIGPRRLWRWSQATMATGALAPVVWPGLPAIMAAALLVGGTFMVNTMAGMQEARRLHGERATALMAAMTAAFALGQVAGPLVVGVLPGPGLDEALVVASVVLLAGAWALHDDRSAIRGDRHGHRPVTTEGGRG